MAKNIKELIDKNSSQTYQVLRKFYMDVVSGAVEDYRMTKGGAVVKLPLTAAVRIEAANALLRMDIDKVQGNAKAKETQDDLSEGNEAMMQLAALAKSRLKQ